MEVSRTVDFSRFDCLEWTKDVLDAWHEGGGRREYHYFDDKGAAGWVDNDVIRYGDLPAPCGAGG